MGVSKNRGPQKSSILIGFSIINHPFWDTTIFGNTHIYIYMYTYSSQSHRKDLQRSQHKGSAIMLSIFDQWLFLVPVKGGRDYITPQKAIYKWYILPIGGLYATYHLLGEPETALDYIIDIYIYI